jgi:hypothetical protein
MIPATGVNSAGLVCDIVGVVIVWYYGLPSEVSRSGANYLLLEQPNDAEKALARHYDRLSRVGLILLILGFVLQLASNFLR